MRWKGYPIGGRKVLSEDKRHQVIALGRLGWPLRRIEEETGIRWKRRGLLENSQRQEQNGMRRFAAHRCTSSLARRAARSYQEQNLEIGTTGRSEDCIPSIRRRKTRIRLSIRCTTSQQFHARWSPLGHRYSKPRPTRPSVCQDQLKIPQSTG